MNNQSLRLLLTEQFAASSGYEGQKKCDYRGKVRDLYRDNDTIIFDHTDRLSAFDCAICLAPYKGVILNYLSSWWWQNIQSLPHHFIAQLSDRRMRVKKATPIAIEVVVRAYLAGSMARSYLNGQRSFWGHTLPDGLKEGHKLDKPIITPTTKAAVYQHDEAITQEDIVRLGLATPSQWQSIQELSLECFAQGSKIVGEKGFILVDTKYEFGLSQGEVILMDEIHTPDSSRFWRTNAQGKRQMFDKEIIRTWLMDQGFSGQSVTAPKPPNEIIQKLVLSYLDFYEKMSGKPIDVHSITSF
jgi:phosphoribosylaminoimidazole-succinocarboxamide synthase